jgi:hypothetical protein
MMKGTWLRFGDSLSYVHLYRTTDYTDILRIKLKTCFPWQVGLICDVSAASSPPTLLLTCVRRFRASDCILPRFRERPGISLVIIGAYVTSQIQPERSSISKGGYENESILS